MKKFIFAWGVFLAAASLALGQEAAPVDTGGVTTSSQPGTPAADTGTVVPPPQESPPADTGAVVVPPVERAPSTTPDTAAAGSPSDTNRTADTTAIPPASLPPPRESAPADTATVVTPPPESAPVIAPLEEEEEAASGEPKQPNRFAFGLVFNDEAPLAMRAWFNPRVGLDVGFGVRTRQEVDQTLLVQHPESTTTLLDLSFDLGLPVRALHKEKVDFIIRPGFGFRTRPGFFVDPTDPTVRSVETSLELEINGTAGFEYYPFEKASFGLFTGIALVQTRPGGSGSTSLRVESLPKKAVNFTFRYYLY